MTRLENFDTQFDASAGRQPQAVKMQAGDSVFGPASLPSHQPHSPSAVLADGDNNYDDKGSSRDDFRNLPTNYPGKGLHWDTIMGNTTHDVCDLVAENLAAYQDGELDAEQTRLVAAHVGKCPRCAGIFDAIQATDETLEREWRDSAPLPSSLRFTQAIDDVMAALPPVPVPTAAFTPRRLHARARWMRFAGGLAGVLILFASLWSSYRIGYAHGRRSAAAHTASASSLSGSASPTQSLSFSPTVSRLSRSLSMPSASRLTPASLWLPLVPLPQRPHRSPVASSALPARPPLRRFAFRP